MLPVVSWFWLHFVSFLDQFKIVSMHSEKTHINVFFKIVSMCSEKAIINAYHYVSRKFPEDSL